MYDALIDNGFKTSEFETTNNGVTILNFCGRDVVELEDEISNILKERFNIKKRISAQFMGNNKYHFSIR